jgi:hypothetical protein
MVIHGIESATFRFLASYLNQLRHQAIIVFQDLPLIPRKTMSCFHTLGCSMSLKLRHRTTELIIPKDSRGHRFQLFLQLRRCQWVNKDVKQTSLGICKYSNIRGLWTSFFARNSVLPYVDSARRFTGCLRNNALIFILKINEAIKPHARDTLNILYLLRVMLRVIVPIWVT